MESSTNAQNLAKAQASVRQKMADQKAAREKFKAENAECLNKMNDAQNALDAAKKACENIGADSIIDKQNKFVEAEKNLKEAEENLKKANRAKLMAGVRWQGMEQARQASIISPPYKSDVKKAEDEYDRKIQEANRALENKNRAEEEKKTAEVNKPADDLVKKANDLKAEENAAQAKYDEIAAECKRIMDEYNNLPDDFDEDTVEKMAEVPAGRNGVNSIASTRQNRNESSTIVNQSHAAAIDSSKLVDLRNVNDKNFRGWSPDVMKGYATVGIHLTPSRTFYMNQNYLFSDSLAKIGYDFQNKFKSTPEIQPLILNEFQPYQMLSIADLIPGAAQMAAGLLSKASNLVGNSVINIAKNAIHNNFLDKFSQNPNELYLTSHRREYFTTDPVTQVRNMFNGGIWLNTYELPFYGKTYLKAANSGKWQLGAAEKALGSGLGDLAKSIGIDYPSNPKFTPSMGSERQVETEFYLINSNSSWLKKNFQFIQAIFAGTAWVHMKYCVVQSPNVYNVLCPGRFQMYWAAMDSEITFEGKLRKNEKVSNELSKLGIKSIDKDMLWPDAWKIKLTIKDLTPNSFNLYADYYENGYCSDEISQLADQKSITDMLGELPKYFDSMLKDTVEAGMEEYGKIKGGVNDALKYLTNKQSELQNKSGVKKDDNGQL